MLKYENLFPFLYQKNIQQINHQNKIMNKLIVFRIIYYFYFKYLHGQYFFLNGKTHDQGFKWSVLPLFDK